MFDAGQHVFLGDVACPHHGVADFLVRFDAQHFFESHALRLLQRCGHAVRGVMQARRWLCESARVGVRGVE